MAGGRRVALIAVLGLGMMAWGVPTVVGATGPVAVTQMPGAADCRPDPGASTAEYLVGVACPPDGFVRALGYQPVLVRTPSGWRYTRPAWTGAECNGPMGDEGLFWDFAELCRVHDYGYDLVRFGIGDRGQADGLLYNDMMASCSDRGPLGAMGCRAVAGWARAVLEVGDALGFDPKVLPEDRGQRR